jgi:hypothetical protein
MQEPYYTLMKARYTAVRNEPLSMNQLITARKSMPVEQYQRLPLMASGTYLSVPTRAPIPIYHQVI